MEQKDVTREIANQYEMVYPLLVSIFQEFKELSKKKQDGSLNAMKVKMTNRILTKSKAILTDDPTIEFLDLLDEEALPTNSDVVLIIAQFIAAMQQFKKHHQVYDGHKNVWNVPEELDDEEDYDDAEDDQPF